jgi:CBS domain-containing protein
MTTRTQDDPLRRRRRRPLGHRVRPRRDARAPGPGFEELTAGDVAATDMVVVQPDDTIEHAAQLMAEHDTAHLIVASPESGQPVGIVSSLDIARALAA